MQKLSPIAEGTIVLPFDTVDDYSDVPSVREYAAQDPLRLSTVTLDLLAPMMSLRERALECVTQISAPAHSALATNDKIVDNGRTQELLSKLGEVVHVPGGHAFVLEQPEIIAQRMTNFIRTEPHRQPFAADVNRMTSDRPACA